MCCSAINISNRVMLVHARKSYRACGAKTLIDDLLTNRECVEFYDFSNNLKRGDVMNGVSLLKEFKPDAIVAIGGGSVIDMAKLVRHYADRYDIPLIAIPTTAGTGAEVTHFAVCYIDGKKHSIADERMRPNHVILRPELTYKNPPYLTACTGFDALAQAIEAYWNVNATHESDEYAVQAIELIFSTLPKRELSHEDRAILLKGANLSGRAIDITKTTVPHAISYTLTSKFGYPHGHAVALTFPYFLKYNLNAAEDKYQGSNYELYKKKMDYLCEMLNVKHSTAFEVMKNYLGQLGLGFDSKRDFNDTEVVAGINMERAKNTPIAINEEIIVEAVKSIRL